MKLEIVKNSKRNTLFGIIDKLVAILFPFVIRTIIINTIGAEYIGLSSLFVSILKILNLAELGIGSSLVFSMYKPIADDDYLKIGALYKLYKKSYLIIGTFVLIIGLSLMPFLEFLISGEVPIDINIYVLYLIYLFNTVIGYLLFGYKNSLFDGYQRTDYKNKIHIIIEILKFLIQMVALLVFKNYYLTILALPITSILSNIFVKYLADKKYPNIKCEGNVDKDTKKELKKKIAGMFIHKLSNTVITSVDSIVISAFLGLNLLTIYTNYYYVMNAVFSLIQVIFNGLTAGIGNKVVKNSVKKNYSDFKKINYIYFALIAVCSGCFISLYQDFITLWVGESYLFDFSTVIWLCFYFISLKMCDTIALYKDANGLWWEDKFRPIISSLINIIVNIILVNTIGINGILISTIIVTIFINYLFSIKVLFKYYFKRNPNKFLLSSIGYIIVFGICTLVAFLSTMNIDFSNVSNIFIKLPIAIISSFVTFFFFTFSKKHLSYYKYFIEKFKLIPKKR